jgi:hypothetical protein
MKKINQEFVLFTSAIFGSKGRLFLMVAVVSLFILTAVAPNATIGIGK